MSTSMKLKKIAESTAVYFPPSKIYFIIDDNHLCKIFNNNVKWYYDESSTFPYYINTYNSSKINSKKINLIDFLYGKNNNIKFKNIYSEYYDLRINNVLIDIQKHKYNDIICKKYKVIEYIQGHFKQDIIINPCWKIQEESVYYLMYCHKDYLVKLTESQYNELKQYESTLDYRVAWIFAFMRSPFIISCNDNNQIKLHHIIKSFNYKSLINLELLLPSKETHDLLSKDIIVKKKYNVINIINGHVKKTGQDAGKEKNRIWEIEEFENTYSLMYCEPDAFIKLCKESYKKILNFEKSHNNSNKITWFKMTNGYIACTFENDKQLYMHQIIMDCYGNGKGTKNISVDHIDQDPTNNMLSNLRIATREEQEQNSKGIIEGTKRARKHNAKPLPEGLTQEMMPKYVVYYNECYNKAAQLYREFFKIEKHPQLDKTWVSSKSNKVDLMTKLESVKNILASL